jgi:hypothetical protein
LNESLEIKQSIQLLKEKFLSNGVGEYKSLLEEIWNRMIINDNKAIYVSFEYNKYISQLSKIGFNATLTMDKDKLVVQITMQED